MADGIPPREPATDAPDPAPQPPPLDSIRVKGPNAKGLNKPAILAVAGGGVAAVLVLASGAFSGDSARKPAQTKPMMSDPARPEMAKGAVRELPATYSEAAVQQAMSAHPAIPELGPPLPGDIAAFAPANPHLRGYVSSEPPLHDDGWSVGESAYAAPAGSDHEQDAERDAERAGLFYALREAPGDNGSAVIEPVAQPPSSALTAFAPRAHVPAAALAARDNALFSGSIITASLVTEVNSQSPGPVIAQVTHAVYDSATGRKLLIPQGARLLGEYKSSIRYGQNRVAIVWLRLIMPDGEEAALAETAVDPSGAAGIPGEVDNHWGDVFGAAALGTLINVGVATTEEPPLSFGGIGAVGRDPVDGAVSDGVQRTASSVTNRVVDRGLATLPTIRVPAGTKVSVLVTRRTEF